MKRLLFIYNPHAGKELLKPKLADVIDIFVKRRRIVMRIRKLRNMIPVNMI